MTPANLKPRLISQARTVKQSSQKFKVYKFLGHGAKVQQPHSFH